MMQQQHHQPQQHHLHHQPSSWDNNVAPRNIAGRSRKGRSLFSLASSVRSLFKSKKRPVPHVFHHVMAENKPSDSRSVSQSSFFSNPTSYMGSVNESSAWSAYDTPPSFSPANGGDKINRSCRRGSSRNRGGGGRKDVKLTPPPGVTPRSKTEADAQHLSNASDTDTGTYTPTSTNSNSSGGTEERGYGVAVGRLLGTPAPSNERRHAAPLPSCQEATRGAPRSLSTASQAALAAAVIEAANILPAKSFRAALTRERHALGSRVLKKKKSAPSLTLSVGGHDTKLTGPNTITSTSSSSNSTGTLATAATSTYYGAHSKTKDDKPRHILDRSARRPVADSATGANGAPLDGIPAVDSQSCGGVRTRGRSGSGGSSSRGSGSGSSSSSSSGKSEVATHGYHPSAADTAVIRAANGGNISLTAKSLAGIPSRAKVIISPMEKNFIRSLEKIDGAESHLPPLLGKSPQQQRFGSLASPYMADKDSEHSPSCAVPLGLKKTLVLDLDETLVSSTRTPCSCDFQIIFKIHDSEPPPASRMVDNDDDNSLDCDFESEVGMEEAKPRFKQISYYVRLRPGLSKFLADAASMYELVVWTASGQAYADAILNLLDPDNNLFSKRLYRDSCVRHRGLCVKDLRRLGRPMSSVLLLDNFVYSFGFTLNNGFPITPWTGTEASDELLIATTFLHKMARVPDVRTPLIKAFDLHQQVHGVRSSSLTPAHLTRLHNNNSSSSGRTRLYHDVASLSTTSTTTDDDTDSRSSSIVSTVSTASSTTTYTSATSQGIESCASFSSCSSWGSEVVGRSGNAPRGWASMLFKKGVPMVDRAARGAVGAKVNVMVEASAAPVATVRGVCFRPPCGGTFVPPSNSE